MARVQFNDVSKRYGVFTAVKNFNLDVADQEFVCLVGPSGCGKTTSLRMLAGLDEITEGTIQIGDRVVNDIPAKDRDIAMVFQSYALYPHYTIYDNLAFGLRTRQKSTAESLLTTFIVGLFYILAIAVWYGLSRLINLVLPGQSNLIFVAGLVGGIIVIFTFTETRRDIRFWLIQQGARFLPALVHYIKREEEIKTKIYETAHLLGIEEQLWKKPKQLSGGQRQRVALGRAIIRNPLVFLMDEPLSNLDAKLRVQMRAELQRLTHKLKVTTIYVTHDQIEAMTLADRIAVMDKGILHQVGSPDEVYNFPIDKFVAGFIGSPSMNFILGSIQPVNEGYIFQCDAFQFHVPPHYMPGLKNYVQKQVLLGIRPEHISLYITPPNVEHLEATVGVLEPIGSDTFVYIDFPYDLSLVVKMEGLAPFDLDQRLKVVFMPEKVHFFDNDTTLRISPEEKTVNSLN